MTRLVDPKHLPENSYRISTFNNLLYIEYICYYVFEWLLFFVFSVRYFSRQQWKQYEIWNNLSVFVCRQIFSICFLCMDNIYENGFRQNYVCVELNFFESMLNMMRGGSIAWFVLIELNKKKTIKNATTFGYRINRHGQRRCTYF